MACGNWRGSGSSFSCLHVGYSAQGPQQGQSHERELFVSAEEAGLRFAARWSLIPLTRAIDTLVIQLQEHSALGQQLLSVASAYKDFVEIISLNA
jgi:hypothetical protein